MAHDLGMTVADVEDHMTHAELMGWSEWYRLRAREREKAQQEAERKARARRR